MKTLAPSPFMASRRLFSTLLAAVLISAVLIPAAAQAPAPRIAGELSTSDHAALPNSANPRAQAQYNTGRLARNTPLEAMSITFSRTQAQEAALKTLIASQQNPASPQYHKWLTADQFAARFGLSDADIAKVQSWLEQQGFAVTTVSRGKDMIRFSGTAAQAEQAFSTELHTYSLPTAHGTESHFAASTALSIPSALSGVVLGIRGLDDFKPHTHLASRRGQLQPHYTWNDSGTQEVFFDPGDIVTVYDIQAEYNASWTGSGQTITIVGQSAISTTDLTNFWTASGITRNNPTITLVPSTGASTTLADGDEAESDLDLEWSGAIAKGAALNFVYAGKSGGAFDAIQYAIDQQIGTIISSSYGDCEPDIGKSDLDSLDSIIERAGSQGQTVLSAAGDTGSADCLEDTDLKSTTEEQALAVDYPASSAYVTGVGGTQISTASASYQTPGDGYWNTNSNSNTGINNTAIKYIPEQAWNENALCDKYALQDGDTTTSDYVCAGGGGASAFFSKPSWQTGVENIPADGMRDVPDVALNAAIYDPGYLLCTSDKTFWQSKQKASCNSGFLDSSSGFPTAGGGTSFATPIFAGMLALINQQYSYTTGQGEVNKTLYTIAASSSYATAFHDITTGNNACDIPAACGSGTADNTTYSAGAGYDQATGLGSVDLTILASVWTTSGGGTGSTLTTTTTVTPASTTPALNASDNFTIAVAASDGSTPTGSISISVDSGTAVTETLSSGSYTYAYTFTSTGSHTVSVTYAGNSTYAASTGSATVTVPAGTSSGTGTFTLSATSVTIAQNSTGTSTLTVTPSSGYTGTVDVTVKTTSSGLSNTLCYDVTNPSITGTTAVTESITLFTSTALCSTSSTVNSTRKHIVVEPITTASISGTGRPAPLAAMGTLALLLLAGLIGRSSSKLRGSLRILASLILIAAAGVAFTGCGNSSTGSTSTGSAPEGTYTLTVTGTDSKTSSITASTTFTLTIN